jgi:hypothetical protein
MADMGCESLRDRLRWLTAALNLHPDPPGLGPLARTTAWDDKSLSLPPLAARALPYAQSFAQGLIQGEVTLLRKGATGLVGLGPGLTPSGDDFLGGWLTTLRCTEGKGGYSPQELDEAATEIRSLARGKTPAISEALLDCALAGDSSEAIHILLNQVLSQPLPPDAEILAHSVREVTRHGHSSGWDALAGMIWGFQSLIERLRAVEPHDRIRIPSDPALR